jgi:L-amino acid N-acyltransferase YncA
MIIRLARIEDLPAIVAIYNQSIPSQRSTADTQPVQIEERKNWFLEHTAEKYPIFIAEIDGQVTGWCSLSAYRPGRAALRYTAEISYYIAQEYHRQGVATALIEYAIEASPQLKLKNLFAIVLERNTASLKLLEKMGFEKWGYLPRVADFDGEETGHLYYGRRVWEG